MPIKTRKKTFSEFKICKLLVSMWVYFDQAEVALLIFSPIQMTQIKGVLCETDKERSLEAKK